MNTDVDERSHTQANHCRVLTVKENCSIDHVQKEGEVRKAPWEVTGHVLQQRHDELKNNRFFR